MSQQYCKSRNQEVHRWEESRSILVGIGIKNIEDQIPVLVTFSSLAYLTKISCKDLAKELSFNAVPFDKDISFDILGNILILLQYIIIL